MRWKIDNGDWEDGPTLSEQNINRDEYTGEFQFSIDTREYEEGEHDLYLQVISGGGLKSEVERRTIDIDNLPPRPNLILMDGVQVTDYGIPIRESLVGSFLEVRGELETREMLVPTTSSSHSLRTGKEDMRPPLRRYPLASKFLSRSTGAHPLLVPRTSK